MRHPIATVVGDFTSRGYRVPHTKARPGGVLVGWTRSYRPADLEQRIARLGKMVEPTTGAGYGDRPV